MGHYISEKKNDLIRQIQGFMKPNTYAEFHDVWARNRMALGEMSMMALRDLAMLLLCKNDKEEKRP